MFVTCGDVGAAEVAYARGSPSWLLAVCFAKPDDSDSPAERSRSGVYRNGLMAELTALLGIQQRFSMALRPCEMGSNERMHQEVQKVFGALVREVGSLENWSDWLVV